MTCSVSFPLEKGKDTPMTETARTGIRKLRRTRRHQEFQRAMHYERGDLDRQTAAVLSTCFGQETLPGMWSVDCILARREEQKAFWQMEIQPTAQRGFTIGDFVTYLLCEQERYYGQELFKAMTESPVPFFVSALEHEQDRHTLALQEDLELAGFLPSSYVIKNLPVPLPI